MSEEITPQAAVAVPEQETTAVPESVDTETPEAEPKTFTQEELNETISKRLAKERRKWEREQAARAAEDQRPPQGPPAPDQFKSLDEYTDALADYKAEQKLAKQEVQKRYNEVEATYAEREEEARTKYDDFQEVAYKHPRDGGPAISNEMADVIKASDIGPEIAYYLGKNPDESRRIFGLHPLLQAREIGKIEVNLTANPPAKKASSAPDPIKPVGTRSSTPSYDTTDPRSIKTMSTSEWIEAERRRQMKKLGAQ
jgi:hypothetical protein